MATELILPWKAQDLPQRVNFARFLDQHLQATTGFFSQYLR